jgi:hemolysin activation/secretion protein
MKTSSLLQGGIYLALALSGVLFGQPTAARPLTLESPVLYKSEISSDRELPTGQVVHTKPLLMAQVIPETLPPELEDRIPPRGLELPSQTPLPEEMPLPPAEDLITPSDAPPEEDVIQPFDEETFVIERFNIQGNTVFSTEELLEEITGYTNRPLRFGDILEARNTLTNKYVEAGYITSGAVFPPQPLIDGSVTFQIIEGQLEDIEVQGTQRLKPAYVNSRLNVGISSPLNINQLQEQLQLLLLNPLIANISADLQAGSNLGTNALVVEVQEASSFDLSYGLDNNRVPSVGSIRNQLRLSEGNLLGFGDAASLGYSLTSGSDEWEASYTVPINPYDGTIQPYW